MSALVFVRDYFTIWETIDDNESNGDDTLEDNPKVCIENVQEISKDFFSEMNSKISELIVIL